MGLERVRNAVRKLGQISAFLNSESNQAASEAVTCLRALNAQTEKSKSGAIHHIRSIPFSEFDPDAQLDRMIKMVVGDNPVDLINIQIDYYSGPTYYVTIVNTSSGGGFRLSTDGKDGSTVFFDYEIGYRRQTQFSPEDISRLEEIKSKYHLQTIAGASLIKTIFGVFQSQTP